MLFQAAPIADGCNAGGGDDSLGDADATDLAGMFAPVGVFTGDGTAAPLESPALGSPPRSVGGAMFEFGVSEVGAAD